MEKLHIFETLSMVELSPVMVFNENYELDTEQVFCHPYAAVCRVRRGTLGSQGRTGHAGSSSSCAGTCISYGMQSACKYGDGRKWFRMYFNEGVPVSRKATSPLATRGSRGGTHDSVLRTFVSSPLPLPPLPRCPRAIAGCTWPAPAWRSWRTGRASPSCRNCSCLWLTLSACLIVTSRLCHRFAGVLDSGGSSGCGANLYLIRVCKRRSGQVPNRTTRSTELGWCQCFPPHSCLIGLSPLVGFLADIRSKVAAPKFGWERNLQRARCYFGLGERNSMCTWAGYFDVFEAPASTVRSPLPLPSPFMLSKLLSQIPNHSNPLCAKPGKLGYPLISGPTLIGHPDNQSAQGVCH